MNKIQNTIINKTKRDLGQNSDSKMDAKCLACLECLVLCLKLNTALSKVRDLEGTMVIFAKMNLEKWYIGM